MELNQFIEFQQFIKKIIKEEVESVIKQMSFTPKQNTVQALPNNLLGKPYLDKNDIAELYKCGATKSMQYIREIKSVSDTLKHKGRVAPNDLNNWLNYTQREVQL